MSKTDKTRPLAVKAMDTPNGIVARHDHRTGECDLPPRPTSPLECLWGNRETRCDWAASMEFLNSAAGHCGCSKCGKRKDVWYQQQKAAARTRHRRTEHDALVAARTYGADDLSDVPDLFGDIALDREYGNFLSTFDHYGHLAERLDLPVGAQIVATDGPYSHCFECNSYEVNDGYAEVLYADGRRRIIALDANDYPLGYDPDADLARYGYDGAPEDYNADPFEDVNLPYDDPFEEVIRGREPHHAYGGYTAFAERYL